MKPQTLIRKFKESQYHTTRQRDIIPRFDIRIRQTKMSYPLWEVASHVKKKVQTTFDDLALFAYHHRFIVECPNSQWNIQKSNGWYVQLVNIESELTDNQDVV